MRVLLRHRCERMPAPIGMVERSVGLAKTRAWTRRRALAIGVSVGASIAAAFFCCVATSGCGHVTSDSFAVDAGESAPTWTSLDAGTVNFSAVSGVGSDAVWIVGDQGTILRWDGNTMHVEPSGTTANLTGVFAVDADTVYAVGAAGAVLQRTGGVWTEVAAGVTTADLTAVWASKTGGVVAVGAGQTVLSGVGGKYTAVTPSAGGETLYAVTGSPTGQVVAVGALAVVYQVTGTSLQRHPLQPGFSKLLCGATVAPQGGFYLVGIDGTVIPFSLTGGASAPLEGFPPYVFRAAAATGADIWVVGWEGAIALSRGGQVIQVPSIDTRWLTGVYAPSTTDVWVVGRSGVVLHGPPTNLDFATTADASGD